MKRLSFYSVMFSFLTASGAYAVPSTETAFEDPDNKIIVFYDTVYNPQANRDKAREQARLQFWYLPLISAKVKPAEEKEDGSKRYRMVLTPYFPQALKSSILNRNTVGITESSQLKPVVLQQMGIRIPGFSVVSETQSVTSLDYMGIPVWVDFTLTDPEQIKEFDYRYQSDSGIPIYVSFSFEAEKVTRHLSLNITCSEVQRTLDYGTKEGEAGIGGTIPKLKAGFYLGADIGRSVRSIVGNNHINMVSKGEVPQMNTIIESVVKSCFDAYRADNYDRWSSGSSSSGSSGSGTSGGSILIPGANSNPGTGTTPGTTPIGEIDEDIFKEIFGTDPKLIREFESLQRSKPRSSASAISRLEFGGSSKFTQIQDPTQDPSVKFVFRFKQDVVKTDKQAFVSSLDLETTLAKHDLAVVIKSENENKSVEKKITVEEIQKTKLKIQQSAKSSSPLQSGLQVGPGDQIRIAATFAPEVLSPVRGLMTGPVSYALALKYRKPKPFLWKAEYKADSDRGPLQHPADALYYRIGMSKWMPVGTYTVIPTDMLDEGELQFYVDKEAIYRQLPSKKRTSYLWGAWEASVPYDNFFPNFEVEISGKKYKIQ